MKLYTFHQSGSAYRVRIALNLKVIAYEPIFVRGGRGSEELRTPAYLKLNPQGVVPTLVDGECILTQSLPIIEYLEESYTGPPLLPTEPVLRARVRSLVQLVVSDIHPLGTARVLEYLEREIKLSPEQQRNWTQHWQMRGLHAMETLLEGSSATGPYCHGDQPTLADICLIPQVYTALRFGCDLSALPTVQRIYELCLRHPAFQQAAPDNQPDFPRPPSL